MRAGVCAVSDASRCFVPKFGAVQNKLMSRRAVYRKMTMIMLPIIQILPSPGIQIASIITDTSKDG
jgi:hypothetical protein